MAKCLVKMACRSKIHQEVCVSPKTPTPKRKSTHTYNDNLTPLTSTSTSILANPSSLEPARSRVIFKPSTLNPMFSFLAPDTRKTSPVSGTVPDMPAKNGHCHLRRMVNGFGLKLAGMAKLVMGGGTRMCTRRVLCETRCLTCICVQD